MDQDSEAGRSQVTQDLAARRWEPNDEEQRRRIRRESVVSLSWIAQRLHMGSVSTLMNALHYASSLV